MLSGTLSLFERFFKTSQNDDMQEAVISSASKSSINYLREAYFDLEDIVPIFRSFFLLKSEIYSVHRELKLAEANKWHLPEQFHSELILTRYKQSSGKLEIDTIESLGIGVDPRVVSDGNSAYVVAQSIELEPQLRAFYRIINVDTKVEEIYSEIEGLPLGKNWQPFIKNNELFILHSFSPLRVIKLKSDGIVEIVHEQETQFDISASHDNYTMFRGGSNGITSTDGYIYGFGHITLKNYKHNIFMWRLSPTWDLDVRISSETMMLNEIGYQICDPTSFFQSGSDFFLGFALSERDWFHAQKFADLLVRLPNRGLEGLFSKGLDFTSLIDVSDFSHLSPSLIPSEYDSDITISDFIGCRTAHAEVGIAISNCIFSRVKVGRNIGALEFIYSCDEKEENEIGSLDILAVTPEYNEDSIRLSRTQLNGTNGITTKAFVYLNEFTENEKFSLIYHNNGSIVKIDNIRLKYN